MESSAVLLIGILVPLCVIIFCTIIICACYCHDNSENYNTSSSSYVEIHKPYVPTQSLTRHVEEFHYGSVPAFSGGIPMSSESGYYQGYTTTNIVYN